MARKIIKTAKGPFEIKSQKESVWVCMCGLSKNQPFLKPTRNNLYGALKLLLFPGKQKDSSFYSIILEVLFPLLSRGCFVLLTQTYPSYPSK